MNFVRLLSEEQDLLVAFVTFRNDKFDRKILRHNNNHNHWRKIICY
jgi:hypothetical protein